MQEIPGYKPIEMGRGEALTRTVTVGNNRVTISTTPDALRSSILELARRKNFPTESVNDILNRTSFSFGSYDEKNRNLAGAFALLPNGNYSLRLFLQKIADGIKPEMMGNFDREIQVVLAHEGQHLIEISDYKLTKAVKKERQRTKRNAIKFALTLYGLGMADLSLFGYQFVQAFIEDRNPSGLSQAVDVVLFIHCLLSMGAVASTVNQPGSEMGLIEYMLYRSEKSERRARTTEKATRRRIEKGDFPPSPFTITVEPSDTTQAES